MFCSYIREKPVTNVPLSNYSAFLISAPDEHAALYEAVYLPAVEAMAPLE